MLQHSVVEVLDRQRSLHLIADRLEGGMYEALLSVAMPVAEFRDTVARLAGAGCGSSTDDLSAACRKLETAVSGLVRNLSEAAGRARRATTSSCDRSSATELAAPLAWASDTRMQILDLAGEAGLMALNATVDATLALPPAAPDSATVAERIAAMTARNLPVAERIARRLGEVQHAVQDAVSGLGRPTDGQAQAA